MNEQQRQAAQREMTEWLAVNKAVDRQSIVIECAGAFDLYHLHYYIFRFKQNPSGNWLIGVCGGYEPNALTHSGHIFSDLNEYHVETAEADAVMMAESIRFYWIEHAREELKKRELIVQDAGIPDLDGHAADRVGSFVGYILLNNRRWDPPALRTRLREDWEIDTPPVPHGRQAMICSVGELLVAVTFLEERLPDGQAESFAATNAQWPKAVDTARAHVAYLMVAVMGRAQPPLEVGQLFVKICDACLAQPGASAILTTGTLFEPSFYRRAAAVMKAGDLPVFNWVYFGNYRTRENKVNAYTYGMNAFGRDEIEVIDSTEDPQELRTMLFNICYYELSQDILLHDASTITYTDDSSLLFRLTKGVSLESYTLKVNLVRKLDIGI